MSGADRQIGPVEALVLEAWGIGIRIDTDIPAQQAKWVDILTRARVIQESAVGCHSCCTDCQEATGGVCRRHQEPECTCYEGEHGHMPACAFNRRAT